MAFPSKSPLSRLSLCPPYLCHALARKLGGPPGNKRKPLDEIVMDSGLTERTYLRTIQRNNWQEVKLRVILGVLAGTEIDPFCMDKHWRYLRKHDFKIPFLTSRQSELLDRICSAKSVDSE